MEIQVKKYQRRYQKRKSLDAQIEEAANTYLRHGGKTSRRKQVERLKKAIRECAQRWQLNSIHQIGKKHVRWFDEQMVRQGLSAKTRQEYFYAWSLLWEWLGRKSFPPKPLIYM